LVLIEGSISSLGASGMPAIAMENLLEHHWHHLPVEEIAELLEGNSEAGLSAEEATKRHHSFGPNELTSKKGKPLWLRFLLQFNQPLIYRSNCHPRSPKITHSLYTISTGGSRTNGFR
jgi:magnesium-transporting ATPase (P-type)